MVSKKFGFPSEKGEGLKIGIVRSVGVFRSCLSASDNLFRKGYFIDPFTKFVTFWLRGSFGINRTIWGMDDK